jgi:hypothetical protein
LAIFVFDHIAHFYSLTTNCNICMQVWNTTLENAALAWAKTCTQGHQNAGYGENLYMYTKNNYPEKDLIAKGIKAWYDEVNEGLSRNAILNMTSNQIARRNSTSY